LVKPGCQRSEVSRRQLRAVQMASGKVDVKVLVDIDG
jgi:hypothetical protein